MITQSLLKCFSPKFLIKKSEQIFNKLSFEILKYFYFLSQPALTANDLRANEGRETKALNCKPITNLKEKSELSNYCKTSGFRLHAVISRFIS